MEFDYQAQHDDELTISVGEVITNIRKEDGGWWEGQINGRRGLFPDNFVRVSTKPNPFSCFLCGLCRPKGCGGGGDNKVHRALRGVTGSWISWVMARRACVILLHGCRMPFVLK